VRPINLIPADQRRGGARGAGGRPSIGVYAVLGGLGVAVVCVLAFVLMSNSINGKTDKAASLRAQAQSEKQVADALRPYGQFAALQQARHQQIASLSGGRFNWERALEQLSLAIPRNVYLLNVAATGSPDVAIDGGGSGGDLGNLRDKANAPAFMMTGCTYSHHAVARMMTRMRNLDDVTDVNLSRSERKEEDSQGAAGGNGAATTDSAAQEDITDCVGSRRVTKFDLLVVFGGAAAETPADPNAAGVPGAAAPAAAQGATGAAQPASTGAPE
jgi:Tfp pilus assembly protein PilN